MRCWCSRYNRRRLPSPLRAVAAVFLLAGCRGSRGTTTAIPTEPDIPFALTPARGTIVDSRTPTLVALNAAGFDGAGATYDFVVLDEAGREEVARVPGVAAGPQRTQAVVPTPLDAGRAYRWKAVAHAGDRTAESTPASFEVAVPCLSPGDAWAKAVVDFQITECTRRTNRRALLDPHSVLGPPDAAGSSDATYSGILSLGQDGHVVVDMGVCIGDRPGDDLRVYQYIQSEPVEVMVSGSPDGPWAPLGTKPCGDGGIAAYRSNHCDFDLGASGLKAARYVWVGDGENYPCERAGTRSEGADIDAVEVLHPGR